MTPAQQSTKLTAHDAAMKVAKQAMLQNCRTAPTGPMHTWGSQPTYFEDGCLAYHAEMMHHERAAIEHAKACSIGDEVAQTISAMLPAFERTGFIDLDITQAFERTGFIDLDITQAIELTRVYTLRQAALVVHEAAYESDDVDVRWGLLAAMNGILAMTPDTASKQTGGE